LYQVYHSAIDGYVNFKYGLAKAFNIVDHMKEIGLDPQIDIYNVILLMKVNLYDGSVDEFYLRLEKMGIKMNLTTFDYLIKHSFATGQNDKTRFYLEQMQARKITINSVLATIVIREYLKLKYSYWAEKFFLALSPEVSMNTNTINCFMTFFHNHCEYRKVIKYLKFALQYHIKIDFYCFIYAIRALVILNDYMYAKYIIEKAADYYPTKMGLHFDEIHEELLLIGNKQKVEDAVLNVKNRFSLLKTYNYTNPVFGLDY